LSEYHIAELNLNASKGTAVDHGNLVGLVSSYKTEDGSTHQMADVWFTKDVQPAAPEHDKPTVNLSDVLAPPSGQLLGDASATTGTPAASPPSAAEMHHLHHLALLDRKLQEDEELRRNGPLI